MLLHNCGRNWHEDVLDRRGTAYSLRNVINFSDGNREAHLLAFYEWLPKALHTVQVLLGKFTQWVLAYCVNTIAEGPDKNIRIRHRTAIGALGQTPSINM